MGETYDIGLQVGNKMAEKVDALIKKLHHSDSYGENMDPEDRKELPDSVLYHWNMKWNPYLYKDEAELVSLLRDYRETNDAGYGYKLVCVGDEGGQDEESNEIGYEQFDGLYNDCSVTFPVEWNRNTYPYISFRTIDENGDYKNWSFERSHLLCWDVLGEKPGINDPVMDIMLNGNMIFMEGVKKDFNFNDVLLMVGAKMPDYPDMLD